MISGVNYEGVEMAERPGPDPERVREALRETGDDEAPEQDLEGPATDELDEDPAYNPSEESGLKDLKGG